MRKTFFSSALTNVFIDHCFKRNRFEFICHNYFYLCCYLNILILFLPLFLFLSVGFFVFFSIFRVLL